jgi:chorismate-pyruvate lyase
VAVALDHLVKTILEAPVGHVEQTLADILKQPVHLDVIEQSLISGTRYNRKIAISIGHVPILLSTVKFDSKNIPKLIMSELLQKKEGIGRILERNNITVNRNILEVNINPDGRKLTRNYEIWNNNSIWFEIIEEIRLDLLSANQNR